MCRYLLTVLFLFTVSNCSTNSSNSAANQNLLIVSNANITGSPTPTNNNLTINDKDFTTTKFVKSGMKKMTLDKQPPEIIKFVLERETSEHQRSAKKINVLVQEKDFNRDKIPERMVYFRQFDNKVGVPLLIVFKKDGDLWSKNIYIVEGSPDEDIPELEFLSKPNTQDSELIKESLVFGDTTEISYLQLIEDNYLRVECRKINPAGSQTVSCRN